ncbi:uncharacterized protein METZ01_LOCUS408582, partial [marine metagenome]
ISAPASQAGGGGCGAREQGSGAAYGSNSAQPAETLCGRRSRCTGFGHHPRSLLSYTKQDKKQL